METISLEKGVIVDFILTENNFGSVGAKALCEALKVNPGLTEFNLESNQIKDDGLCAIVDGLKENFSLTTLNVECLDYFCCFCC